MEYRMVEMSAMEQNKEIIMKRNEDSLRDLRYTIKYTNMWTIGVSEEKEKGPEKIFEEIIVENFPNTGKKIVTKSRKRRETHPG